MKARPGREGAGTPSDPGRRLAAVVHPRARAVLAAGVFAVFAGIGLGRFGYTMILPAMQASLGLTNTQTGLLATANLAGYLAMSAVGGALASHYGPRVVISVGLVVAGIGMALTGLAGNLVEAAIWRTVTGLGSGCVLVPTLTLMGAWFPVERRGLAAGTASSGQAVGLVLAGLLTPALLSRRGPEAWRLNWFLFAAVTAAAAATAVAAMRNRPQEARGQGAAVGGAEAAGTVRAANPGSSATLAWSHAYRSRRIWHLGAVYLTFGFSYIIYITFFAKRLEADLGVSVETAGDLFMLMGVCLVASSVFWGWASDKLGRKSALIAVYCLQGLAMLLFALWGGLAGATVSVVLFGLSALAVPPVMAAECGDLLGPRLAPAAFGFITLFFGVGQAAGPSVAGALADVTGDFQAAFLAAAGVALLGGLAAALLPRRGVAA